MSQGEIVDQLLITHNIVETSNEATSETNLRSKSPCNPDSGIHSGSGSETVVSKDEFKLLRDRVSQPEAKIADAGQGVGEQPTGNRS